MPTYEYKCDACQTRFEKFQSIKADPIKRCPHCGKNKVQRLISSGAGLIFKGSGFYITDYRSDSYKQAAKSDSAPGTGSDSKKSDAAPAASGTPAAPAASGTPAGGAAPAKPAPAAPSAPATASRSAAKKKST